MSFVCVCVCAFVFVFVYCCCRRCCQEKKYNKISSLLLRVIAIVSGWVGSKQKSKPKHWSRKEFQISKHILETSSEHGTYLICGVRSRGTEKSILFVCKVDCASTRSSRTSYKAERNQIEEWQGSTRGRLIRQHRAV